MIMGQSTVSSNTSSAKAVTKTNSSLASKRGQLGRDSQKGRRRDPSQQCEHCKSPNHTIYCCLKDQNNDLKNTIEYLLKNFAAIGKAKIVHKDNNSDYLDSLA